MSLYDIITDILAAITLTVIVVVSLIRGHKDRKSENTVDDNCIVENDIQEESLVSEDERSDILEDDKGTSIT